jgi:hypothetical protein
MKKALFLCLTLLPLISWAQDIFQGIPRDSVSGKIVYEGVVQVPGASKQELYMRAQEWAVKTFRSAKDVLQVQDASGGRLIAKACYEKPYYILASRFVNYFWHTVKVDVKDGRYRYEITDFYIEGTSKMLGTPKEMEAQIPVSSKSVGSGVKSGNPKGNYKQHIDGVKELADAEITSLKAAMLTKTKDF